MSRLVTSVCHARSRGDVTKHVRSIPRGDLKAEQDAGSTFPVHGFKSWLSTHVRGKRKLNTDVLYANGDYILYFDNIFKYFPRRRVFIVDKSDIYRDLGKVLSALHKFLKVHQLREESHRQDGNGGFCFTITEGREKCVRDSTVTDIQILMKEEPFFMRQLQAFFNTTNNELFEYLNMKFDWI